MYYINIDIDKHVQNKLRKYKKSNKRSCHMSNTKHAKW